MWLRRMYELACYERDRWHDAYEASERECAALRAEVELRGLALVADDTKRKEDKRAEQKRKEEKFHLQPMKAEDKKEEPKKKPLMKDAQTQTERSDYERIKLQQ